jgi:hypothetical protein
VNYRFALILIALLGALSQGRVAAATLVVNEYWNGSGNPAGATKMNSDEYIEFVVGQRVTAAQLAQMSFGDTNDNKQTLRSVFQFDEATLNQVLLSAGRTDFLPGTLIVVKGAGRGSQELGYNPLTTNTTNDNDWGIQLVAGQGAKDHSESLINGTLMIGNSGEVVWVSSDCPPANNAALGGIISALGHGGSSGAVASEAVAEFGSGVIYSGSVGQGNSVFNGGSVGTPVVGVSSTGTLGAVNGGANSTSIYTLRGTAAGITSVPEPSRLLLLLLGLALLPRRRSRKVNLQPTARP